MERLLGTYSHTLILMCILTYYSLSSLNTNLISIKTEIFLHIAPLS